MDDLDRDFIRAMCPKPCEYITTTEVLRHPDDREELVRGEPPLPLCRACPILEEARPPIMHIEIVRNYPPDDLPRAVNGPTPHERREDSPASPAPPLPNPVPGPEPEPEPVVEPEPEPADDNPDDLPIPPSWGPHHPAHPDFKEPEPPEGGVPSRPARNPWRDGGGHSYPGGDPGHWSF